MNETLRRIYEQTAEFFKGMTPPKRVAFLGTAFAVLAGVVALFQWAGQKTYKPLMTNLNPEDVTNIIRVLREKRIPFNVDPTGRNIEIPPENLYDLRLELATMGYPQSSVVGYEIFDKQSLGTTSYVQKINQRRALEGELMRTINSIRGIRRSRVHLVSPEKTTFVEDQKKSSASVVLDVEPGVTLSEKQVAGIAVMVSRAVEGMDVDDVAIVDSMGKQLSKNNRDGLIGMSASQIEFQRKLEEDTEKRIEAMLARVVGDGHVVARVSADLDFSRTDQTETLYDADGAAVRSVNKDSEQMEGVRPGPQGVPGSAANTPGQQDPGGKQIRNTTSKGRETTNYAIPETVRRTTKAPGSINRMSVAVVVDGKQVRSTDEDGKTLAKVEPWSPEKLKEFESLVVTAAGLNLKRGDTIEIKNMEFQQQDFTEAQRMLEESERRSYLRNIFLYGVIGLIAFMFFMFVVRPFIRWVTDNTSDGVETFLPQTIEELERLQKNSSLPGLEDVIPTIQEQLTPDKVEGDMIREKILGMIEKNPQKASMIVRDWIRGEQRRTGTDGSRTA